LGKITCDLEGYDKTAIRPQTFSWSFMGNRRGKRRNGGTHYGQHSVTGRKFTCELGFRRSTTTGTFPLPFVVCWTQKLNHVNVGEMEFSDKDQTDARELMWNYFTEAQNLIGWICLDLVRYPIWSCLSSNPSSNQEDVTR
jgi:hypothetical protein